MAASSFPQCRRLKLFLRAAPTTNCLDILGVVSPFGVVFVLGHGSSMYLGTVGLDRILATGDGRGVRNSQTYGNSVCWRRANRVGASDRRAVDDEHRHRRRGGTAEQVAALAAAGSQLVRVTVNNEEAAAAVPEIVAALGGPRRRRARSSATFTTTATCCSRSIPSARARWRSTASTRATSAASAATRTSARSCRSRVEHDKPVRIGVNWGSLDQDLLTQMMDENAARAEPRDAKDVYIEAMLASALRSAELAEEVGLGTIASSSRRRCRTVPGSRRRLSSGSPLACDYPLHLGLTEAGMGMKGIVASTAALSILLAEGIGDTIRVSLTPKPNGDRTEEVLVAQQILQSLGLAASRRR